MVFPAPRRTSGPRVVVVGAGVIGLCCALEITRGGGAVTVIESDAAPARLRVAPRAASLAAAGMLGAFSEALHEGPGTHRRLSDLCWEGLKAWRALVVSDPALAGFVTFNGALLLAHDDADAARVNRAADRAKRHGAPYEMFDGLPPGLDARLYGAKVRLSVRLPGEGAVAVEPTLARLAETALALGASIVRERAVVEVVATNGRVSGVRLDDGGALPADVVVLATGALAPELFVAAHGALQRLTPAKGMLGGALAPTAFDLSETVRTPRIYFGREGDRIFFGATSEPGRADLDADPDAIAALHLEVRRTLPGARFDLATSVLSVGVRPLSPDGAPLVGRDGLDGLIVAVGHGRNGWLLAPVTGVAVAAIASGADPAPVWRDFTSDRFA